MRSSSECAHVEESDEIVPFEGGGPRIESISVDPETGSPLSPASLYGSVSSDTGIPLSVTKEWLDRSQHKVAVRLRDFNLTFRQAKFVIYYLTRAAGNGAMAARLAGYSPKTARVIAAENLTKPNIEDARLAIAPLLEISEGLLTNVLLDAALHARRTYRSERTRKGKCKGCYLKEVIEFVSGPDWKVRIRAARTLWEIGQERRARQSAWNQKT